jgi:hypothetical protein
MQSIKFKSDKTVKTGSDTYKPYTVGDLPPSFGYIAQKNRYGEIKEGVSEWFNYKGLTYIKQTDKWYDSL